MTLLRLAQASVLAMPGVCAVISVPQLGEFLQMLNERRTVVDSTPAFPRSVRTRFPNRVTHAWVALEESTSGGWLSWNPTLCPSTLRSDVMGNFMEESVYWIESGTVRLWADLNGALAWAVAAADMTFAPIHTARFHESLPAQVQNHLLSVDLVHVSQPPPSNIGNELGESRILGTFAQHNRPSFNTENKNLTSFSGSISSLVIS